MKKILGFMFCASMISAQAMESSNPNGNDFLGMLGNFVSQMGLSKEDMENGLKKVGAFVGEVNKEVKSAKEIGKYKKIIKALREDGYESVTFGGKKYTEQDVPGLIEQVRRAEEVEKGLDQVRGLANQFGDMLKENGLGELGDKIKGMDLEKTAEAIEKKFKEETKEEGDETTPKSEEDILSEALTDLGKGSFEKKK
jgi:hypothetical protein